MIHTIGILQPGYLPWLGFFSQMDTSFVFVLYDDVQFDKHGWRNRNRIKTPQGIQWLTVPVYHKGLTGQLIKDVEINNTECWSDKHIKSIRQNYSKAKFFKDNSDKIFECINKRRDSLLELDMELIMIFSSILGIDKKLVLSSTLGIDGGRIDRLIKIIKHFGGNKFVEGKSGKAYIDEKVFNDNGIKLVYQYYHHPVYQQLYSEFIPYLSIIDLIFNCGPESLKILREGQN